MIRILIVDDDPSTRFVLRLILEKEGYEVQEASHGATALELLASDPPPDIVTADLTMPMMDGFELIQRLRSEARTAALPVVVVTSNPEAAQILDSSGLVAAIVSKPFTAAALAARIQEVAILKMRDSDHEKGLRTFEIGRQGFEVKAKLEGVTGLLGWSALRGQENRGSDRRSQRSDTGREPPQPGRS